MFNFKLMPVLFCVIMPFISTKLSIKPVTHTVVCERCFEGVKE